MNRDDSRKSTGSATMGADDRALSEVLSYVLIFTLIVVSIAIVTVGGLGSLQDARTHEHISNAERAFDVLHDNLADVHAEGAPSRATEISLGDAQLYLEDNVTMEVRIVTAAGVTEDVEKEFRPIVFRVRDERRMVYEAGATLMTQREGGIVVNEPPFLVESPDRAHVPIVQTSAPAVTSVGSGNVLVRGQSATRTVEVSETTGTPTIVHIKLETPRAETWGEYFEEQSYCDNVDVDTAPSPPTVTCEINDNVDQLYVTVQTIDVTLIK